MKNNQLNVYLSVLFVILFFFNSNAQNYNLLNPDTTNKLIDARDSMRFDLFYHLLERHRQKKIILIPRSTTFRNVNVYINSTENPEIKNYPLPIALELPTEKNIIKCENSDQNTELISFDPISNKTGLFILSADACEYYHPDSIMIELQKDTIEHLDTIIDSLGNRIDTLDSCVFKVTKQYQRLLKESRSELKYSLWITGGAALFSFTGAAMENWYYLNRIEDQYHDAQNTTDALNLHIKYKRHQTLRSAALGVGTVSAVLFSIQAYKFFFADTNSHTPHCASKTIKNFDLMISYSPDDNGTSISFIGAIPTFF